LFVCLFVFLPCQLAYCSIHKFLGDLTGTCTKRESNTSPYLFIYFIIIIIFLFLYNTNLTYFNNTTVATTTTILKY